ncbi:M10 family metallopeptidase C-terminal domain-containing protein [Falsiroseomonas selenitidurans]|uniref:Endonuclease n=1 Tax=Falsiroseomonas selenitidurans TaxID=2716335 RepID=A0ABX1E6R9_9PROT|nr:endonuclease/exonuclease/phosphatase family protein [Falsiroseomonas selenitidurans]NKC32885.1 endonuclease [Falsiroseomonas selenitidurans]
MATGIFINEIHYDNDGTDTGEAIEVVGPAGTDLTGYTLVRYNGNNGAVYTTPAVEGGLSGVLADQGGGFGTQVVTYPANGLQNGAPDGIALVDPDGNVLQFLSYEGSFTATDGPAAGMTSTDIGVLQGGSDPVGSALQLTGNGTVDTDFTWAATAGSNSFGAINPGQSFGGESQPGFNLSADSLALTEGGAAGSFTLALLTQPTAEVTVMLTAPVGELALDSATLVFTTENWNLPRTVNVTALEDSLPEGSEVLAIALTVTSADANYDDIDPVVVEVTVQDALPLTAIYDIQGAGHSSGFLGQTVSTSGIVTAVDSNGYYLQDAAGDGSIATSDAIFVFTSSAPAVTVGDAVTVRGTVSEFFPGGAATGNLSTTQISATQASATQVTSSGNALPDAILLGPDGRLPPTGVIEDDNFASFDPTTDGTDFFESLEAMRVTVQAPTVVGATNGFGEIYTVVDAPGGGLNATGLSDRGTLNIEPGTGGAGVTNVVGGDFNPERIQIDDDTGLFNQATPEADVGDRLTDVTGVVSYNFGNYEVLPTQAYGVAEDAGLARETTALVGVGEKLSIATYNVLNLDPKVEDINLVNGRSSSNVDDDVGRGQFDAIARQIVDNLHTPDIIALQEVQDGDGAEISDLVSAAATLQALVDAIVEAGGPQYAFADNPFIGNGTSGGQPGANIRTAFLYDPARVTLVEGSLRTVTDPVAQQTDTSAPFYDTRLPLVADFVFQGETVTVVNNHLSSKGGSTPLFGAVQPPLNGSEAQRQAQAEALADFVRDLQVADANANIVLLGDLNEFEFEEPLQALAGPTGPLVNLTETLPALERYSYNFEGNSQSLDHVLVSGNLVAESRFDAVHVNSEFADQASDHDPLVVEIALGQLALEGDAGADRLVGRGGADRLEGLGGDDRLLGRGGNDLLDGGEGEDRIVGDAGADSLMGGAGNDTMWGGADDDLVIGDAGADRILGDAGNDRLFGLADEDVILGGAGNDLLEGGDGADRLLGQAGDDILFGGLGADVLLGGTGADVFSFGGFEESLRGQSDRIRDFSVAEGDRISFVAIDANAMAEGDQAFAFVGEGAFLGGGQGSLRLLFGATGTAIQLDAGDGGEAEMVVLLVGQPALTASDFIL